jgi:hypothetical protein
LQPSTESDESAQVLPDETIVLRGGVMQPRDLEVNAYTHYDEFSEYALSVFAVPGADLATTARVADRPNASIRVTTAGRIRAAGYELRRSEPPPGHADLKLPNPPTDADWETLRVVFDDPIPNPYRRSEEPA